MEQVETAVNQEQSVELTAINDQPLNTTWVPKLEDSSLG